MVVSIGDVSVSIPVGIDKWAHESADNMVEFNAMIETMTYAVNKTMKARYSSGPYQKVYEKQLKELLATGMNQEEADKLIEHMVDVSLGSSASSLEELESELWVEALKNLIK